MLVIYGLSKRQVTPPILTGKSEGEIYPNEKANKEVRDLQSLKFQNNFTQTAKLTSQNWKKHLSKMQEIYLIHLYSDTKLRELIK